MDFIGKIIFLILILSVISCGLNEETRLHQEFDKQGRLISEKVKGYDCCEGFYTKTFAYDTLGNIVKVFGNTHGDRMKEVYKYDGLQRVFEGYYEIYEDSLGDDFNRDTLDIHYLNEINYYSNEQKKNHKWLRFFEPWENRDTSSLTIIKYDSLGNILVHTSFDKERDYSRNEQTGILDSIYSQITVFEDKIKNQIDTIAIDTLVMGVITRRRLNEL